MRHHGWLLRACALVLLFLMFVTKFISYKAVNDYGEVAGVQNWTLSGHKVAKLSMPTSGKTLAPQQDQSSASPATTEWEGVLAERIQLLSTVCKDSQLRNSTHVPISKFVLDRIFVCDKHSILFCQTPKVGNTQWKKVLIALNGTYSSVEEIPENLVHDHEKNGLPRLSSFKPQEVALRTAQTTTTTTSWEEPTKGQGKLTPSGTSVTMMTMRTLERTTNVGTPPPS